MTKLVIISDTHNRLDKLIIPDGDILIHAGDATSRGDMRDLLQFNKEIGKLTHPVKIFIPGNHDLGCENNYSLIKNSILTNITHYLVDESIEIDGIKIYGSPWQPEFHNWAFNLPRGKQLKEKWDRIPDDTNILITHGPPYNILDNTLSGDRAGCKDMMKRIKALKDLKFHIFGHIHERYGFVIKNQTCFVNASSCNEHYLPINPPLVFEY